MVKPKVWKHVYVWSGSTLTISQNTKQHYVLKRPNITTKCLSSRQAQLRVQESSQKLDLLRLSLEKCLKETNQEPLQQPAGGAGLSEEPPSPDSSRPGRPVSTSPSIFSIRPASLTGIIANYAFSEQYWTKQIKLNFFVCVCIDMIFHF